MSEETQVAKIPTASVGALGIQIENLDQMWWLANRVHQSGLAPKGMESPEAVAIAVQMGL